MAARKKRGIRETSGVEKTMSDEKPFSVEAYQTLKFHPNRDYEIDGINNLRRCLAFKYFKSISIDNEFVTTLFKKNLEDYVNLKKTKENTIIDDNDKISKKIKFKSGLDTRENGVMEFLESLPCQTGQWNYCKSRLYDNLSTRDIKRIFNCDKNNSKRDATSAVVEKPLKLCGRSDNPRRIVAFNRKYVDDPDVPDNDLEIPNEPPKIDSFQSARAIKQVNDNKMKRKNSMNKPFVCPLKRDPKPQGNSNDNVNESKANDDNNILEDERLKNIDEKMIELIKNEIMDGGATVKWNDVAGLTEVKEVIKEIVVLPMLRPDIFTGLRRPPKGILLFGPPGTGKTLIGKCIASQSKSTFFSISASSLTSKWVGEGEKMVRALFAVARVRQPSVVFIDEIDSLLTQRSETEHESSRRIKTEFLVQLDGANTTGEEDRILVIGATNRPQELDEAARRRFVKRLYIPLPEEDARKQIVQNLLENERNNLTEENVDEIARLTRDYSGADMANLCKEASMGPIRSIPFDQLENIHKDDVRCVTVDDFYQALNSVRPSVSRSDLGLYIKWDQTYGSGTNKSDCNNKRYT